MPSAQEGGGGLRAAEGSAGGYAQAGLSMCLGVLCAMGKRHAQQERKVCAAQSSAKGYAQAEMGICVGGGYAQAWWARVCVKARAGACARVCVEYQNPSDYAIVHFPKQCQLLRDLGMRRVCAAIKKALAWK